MKNIKKILIVFLFAFVFISFTSCSSGSDDFKNWNEAKSLTLLKEYVDDVTNEKSANFIPKDDRIAVFDMDGTLYGELFPMYLEYLMFAYRALDDKTYNAPDDVKEVALAIREQGVSGTTPMGHALAAAKAYSGMSLSEFDKFTADYLKTPVAGFTGMTYKEALYKPMMDVVFYLQKHDFVTYVVSGSDRYLCRTLICDQLNIHPRQVIGMNVKLKAKNQPDDVDALDYQFATNDELIRTSEVLIKNLKTNKVLQIAEEIGKQPVLSFGNSSGDTSMHQYTINNNKYKSLAFMLIADDEARDYGNTLKTTELGKEWEKLGFNVISMKNDFKTIYGENVVKTHF